MLMHTRYNIRLVIDYKVKSLFYKNDVKMRDFVHFICKKELKRLSALVIW